MKYEMSLICPTLPLSSAQGGMTTGHNVETRGPFEGYARAAPAPAPVPESEPQNEATFHAPSPYTERALASPIHNQKPLLLCLMRLFYEI
jgi:hypothetical protein